MCLAIVAVVTTGQGLSEHARGVLAQQLRADLGLALEARGGRGCSRVQHLDRHGLAELVVARGKDGAHAAAADQLLEPILAGDDVARLGEGLDLVGGLIAAALEASRRGRDVASYKDIDVELADAAPPAQAAPGTAQP